MAVISKLNIDGQDITKYNNSTIRNIHLNGVDYHFAKANEVSDGICENAVNEPIIDMQISGNSVQQTYTGKNLFDGVWEQGHRNQEGLNALRLRNKMLFPVKANTTYTFSSNLAIDTYRFGMAVSTTKTYPVSSFAQDTGWIIKQEYQYTPNTDGYLSLILGRIDNTEIIPEDIKDFWFQIEEGSTATDYEPYVGGTASPNPNYPQQIESVGEKTKNLFDITKAENGTIASETGTDLGTDSYPNRCRSGFIYLTAGNYTISFKELISTGSYLHRYSSTNASTWLGRLTFEKTNSVSKFTLSSACYVRFTIQPINTSGSLVLNTQTLKQYEPQLEKGDIVTEYEPYGYKVPINVRQNLFDVNNYTLYHYTIDTTEIWHNDNANTIIIPCEIGRTYKISVDYNVTLFRVATVDEIPTDRTTAYNIVRQTNNEPITITAEQPYLCVQLGQATWNNSIQFLRIETDFITNIYLNEPLRGIAGYHDYIDYKNKKVVRNIVSEYIDTVGYVSGDDGTYKKFLSDIETKPLLSGSGTTATGFAISNKFNRSIYNYTDMTHHPNQIQTYITTSGVNRVSYTFNDSSITTIEQAQSLIGDGFEVCYVLATPTEEAIDIPEISTNDGTNTFEVETSIEPSQISVDYWKQI